MVGSEERNPEANLRLRFYIGGPGGGGDETWENARYTSSCSVAWPLLDCRRLGDSWGEQIGTHCVCVVPTQSVSLTMCDFCPASSRVEALLAGWISCHLYYLHSGWLLLLLSLQSCPTLSDPMDCSLPGSSVHGIFQARVLEWGAIAFSDSGWLPSITSNSGLVGGPGYGVTFFSFPGGEGPAYWRVRRALRLLWRFMKKWRRFPFIWGVPNRELLWCIRFIKLISGFRKVPRWFLKSL